jgi:hypothetical protein
VPLGGCDPLFAQISQGVIVDDCQVGKDPGGRVAPFAQRLLKPLLIDVGHQPLQESVHETVQTQLTLKHVGDLAERVKDRGLPEVIYNGRGERLIDSLATGK